MAREVYTLTAARVFEKGYEMKSGWEDWGDEWEDEFNLDEWEEEDVPEDDEDFACFQEYPDDVDFEFVTQEEYDQLPQPAPLGTIVLSKEEYKKFVDEEGIQAWAKAKAQGLAEQLAEEGDDERELADLLLDSILDSLDTKFEEEEDEA